MDLNKLGMHEPRLTWVRQFKPTFNTSIKSWPQHSLSSSQAIYFFFYNFIIIFKINNKLIYLINIILDNIFIILDLYIIIINIFLKKLIKKLLDLSPRGPSPMGIGNLFKFVYENRQRRKNPTFVWPRGSKIALHV